MRLHACSCSRPSRTITKIARRVHLSHSSSWKLERPKRALVEGDLQENFICSRVIMTASLGDNLLGAETLINPAPLLSDMPRGQALDLAEVFCLGGHMHDSIVSRARNRIQKWNCGGTRGERKEHHHQRRDLAFARAAALR